MGDRSVRRRHAEAPADDVASVVPGVSPRSSRAPGLVVGPAGDPAEREADIVAAAVMRRVLAAPPSGAPDGRGEPRIRRSASPSADVSRSHVVGAIGEEGGAVDAGTESRIQRARGAGAPLDAATRQSMEGGFGADFSAVRIHADARADDLSTRIQAKAFTTGNDIFFKQGEYDPSSEAGRHLLAHELTHVVQQQGSAQRSISRAIDADQVARMAKYLGIESQVRAVEVPKDPNIKTTTPFSAYPAASKLNLPKDLAAKSMILLQYPDFADQDADFRGYFESMAASEITAQLGGGAYNHVEDLVVLREPYTEPELLHEMGHKAQADAGINADTASVLFLEYQNVILHQNSPWWLEKEDAPAPRLQYSTTGISTSKISTTYGIKSADEMTPEIWDDFKKTAVATLHHDHPKAGEVLEGIEASLTGRYARESDRKGRFDNQVKFNLIAEYLDKR